MRPPGCWPGAAFGDFGETTASRRPDESLKSLYVKVLAEIPPKTHNLLYLLDKIGKKPEQELEKFMTKLNTASVATRYPDDLAKIQAAYTEEVTQDMITKSKD